jgi:hypothetical protein
VAEQPRGAASPGAAEVAAPRRAADIAAEADGRPPAGGRDPGTAIGPGQPASGGPADPAVVGANGHHRAAGEAAGGGAGSTGSVDSSAPAGAADRAAAKGGPADRADHAGGSGDRAGESEQPRRADRRGQLVKGAKLVKSGADALRSRVASALWVVALLAAGLLALAALLVALDANTDNVIVTAVIDGARGIDGPFWRVFEFTEQTGRGREVHNQTKEVLVNWGLAAVAYLVAGRLLDRIIRP